MPPYTGPSKERESYDARFIRVEDTLFVTDPTRSPEHKTLAKEEGILEDIARLKIEKPSEVDGGYLTVENGFKFISLAGMSLSLDLPISEVKKEARSKTVVVFQRLTPGYEIIA